MAEQVLKVGVITVSDRASRGEYEDISGPAIKEWLERVVITPFEVYSQVVPDDFDAIGAAIIKATDEDGAQLVLTTGGTGPAPRDVTPEATLAVADREMPGFGEQMRAISLKYVPTAILSRQVGALRGTSLIVNLPGSPRSIAEILDELFASIPYCIELMGGPFVDTDPEVVKAFRPKKK